MCLYKNRRLTFIILGFFVPIVTETKILKNKSYLSFSPSKIYLHWKGWIISLLLSYCKICIIVASGRCNLSWRLVARYILWYGSVHFSKLFILKSRQMFMRIQSIVFLAFYTCFFSGHWGGLITWPPNPKGGLLILTKEALTPPIFSSVLSKPRRKEKVPRCCLQTPALKKLQAHCRLGRCILLFGYSNGR